MRSLVIGAVFTLLLAGGAVAQEGAGKPNPAVAGRGNTSSTVNVSGTATIVAPAALRRGANSFTERQVRARLEGAGFTGVTALRKDAGGIWRGTGTRDGRPVTLGFDYKGSIGAE